MIGTTTIAALLAAVGTPALAQAPAVTTNSIGMKFVRIAPGEMVVGVFRPSCPSGRETYLFNAPRQTPEAQWSPEDQKRCEELVARDRRDGFKVSLPKAFDIGQYEVTQAQWRQVMGNNPSTFQGDKAQGDSASRPVDSVGWADAQAFVQKLNALERTRAYRLPTEYEWEYACRAGGPGQQSRDQVTAMTAGAGAPPPAAGAPRPADAPPTTSPVGTKAPNAWGLYDVLGNVWEWVADDYDGRFFAGPKPTSRPGAVHVIKGGAFTGDTKNNLCSTHIGGPADRWNVGFRIVRDPE